MSQAQLSHADDISMREQGSSNEPKRPRLDAGFTLVEILIVIVILGILATVTVFAVRGSTDQAEDSTCVYERRVVLTAVESYFAEHQRSDIDPTGTDNDRYERTMSDLGYFNGPSENFDVAADGAITVQSGSMCEP